MLQVASSMQLGDIDDNNGDNDGDAAANDDDDDNEYNITTTITATMTTTTTMATTIGAKKVDNCNFIAPFICQSHRLIVAVVACWCECWKKLSNNDNSAVADTVFMSVVDERQQETRAEQTQINQSSSKTHGISTR